MILKRIKCYIFHRKYWDVTRFLGYTDHNTIANCKKCGCDFTLD